MPPICLLIDFCISHTSPAFLQQHRRSILHHCGQHSTSIHLHQNPTTAISSLIGTTCFWQKQLMKIVGTRDKAKIKSQGTQGNSYSISMNHKKGVYDRQGLNPVSAAVNQTNAFSSLSKTERSSTSKQRPCYAFAGNIRR